MAEDERVDENLNISDEELEEIAAGLIHVRDDGLFEVIDFEGNVVGTYTRQYEALNESLKRGLRGDPIYQGGLEYLRSRRGKK